MYRTLLVPLDGSEAAEEALTPALRLAQDDDAELVLLRAVEPQWPAGPAGRALPVTGRRRQEAARRYLAGLRDQLLYYGVPIGLRVARGPAAEAILSCAASLPADLVVMTTHGRSGLARWILGSVTERVVRHSPCPVLVIRPGRPWPAEWLPAPAGSQKM